MLKTGLQASAEGCSNPAWAKLKKSSAIVGRDQFEYMVRQHNNASYNWRSSHRLSLLTVAQMLWH